MELFNTIAQRFENTEISFWLGAIAGVGLIFLVRFALNTLLKRRFKRQKLQAFLHIIVNWVSLFVLIVYLLGYFSGTPFLYQTLFVFGDTQITLILILTIFFSIILALKFSKAVREFILPILYNRYDLNTGLRASFDAFFNYFIVTLSVIISLSSIGFNLDSLAVFASVLGVGIGFGLKNVMANFISGIIILFERPISVGDRIIIDNTIANIEEIKIRATIVRTRLNERMIIPNSFFLEEKFVNRSYVDERLRIAVNTEVAYGSDVDLVEKLLHECVEELKKDLWSNIVDEPDPRVFFEDFGESGLKFSVWFWIDSQEDEREFRIPSDLRFKIIKKFEEHSISIPFPQRDLHIIPKDN